MVYEKKAIKPSTSDDSCSFCDRPKTTVVCGKCSRSFANMRAKKICAKHPRTLNTMDLGKCPTCKSENLLEVVSGTEKTPLASSSGACNSGAVPKKTVVGTVTMKPNDPPKAVQVDRIRKDEYQPCICDRYVNFTVCTECGELLEGRKYIPCPVHPKNQDGWRKCSNSNCQSEELEES